MKLSSENFTRHPAGPGADPSTPDDPTTRIRKSFVTGETWNPSMWSEPAYDKKMMRCVRYAALG